MAIGARSQSAKTYLERHYSGFADLSRDELIKHVVKALHTCTESDKDLTVENTVIAVVGEGERFHIIEGESVAPYLVGIESVPRPAHTVDEAEASTRMPVEGESSTSAGSLQPPSTSAGAGAGSTGMDIA
jgi:20S proteasome subunit alpha 6